MHKSSAKGFLSCGIDVSAAQLVVALEGEGGSWRQRSFASRAGNRYLRRALYMPALVAVRRDPHLRAFYQALLARHKAKLQALMAVARKMLHAIFGMFRGNADYDGSRLFPALELAAAT